MTIQPLRIDAPHAALGAPPAATRAACDEALIARIAAGDKLAMRALFARHQVRIEHLKVLAMKAKEKHPDFDETIRQLNLPTSQAMLEAILDSELGAEIIYWLGKHPADCRLIGDLPPLSTVREIGRIEGTIAPLAP